MTTFLKSILESRIVVQDWKGEWFEAAEHKEDGYRLTIVRDHADYYAIGRKERINLWQKLCRTMPITLPPFSAIDGEYVGGDFATDAPGALNAGTGKFVAFTALRWEDWEPADYIDSRALLVKHGFEVPKRYLGPFTHGEMLSYVANRGLEGLVLKVGANLKAYRVKPIKTADLRVFGWNEGTGRNKGKLGSLTVGTTHPICDVGSGFNDEQRLLKPEDVIGRIVEVEYDLISAKGGLRFPVFKRFRDDKDTVSL